ncbi:MAG: hypothetical protein ACK4NY_01765 [Spirosomataceae bacterium]
MKPLVVLVSVFLVSIFVIKLTTRNYDVYLSARIGMCGMLIFTAIGHFTFTKGMALMIPPMIPLKTEIIYFTGFLEILLGICLLIPRLSIYSGWILIAFFILLLPANIYASIKHIDYQKATFDGNGLDYLWFRIPLQFLFIAWTYFSTIKR